jgi:hypothetical protein
MAVRADVGPADLSASATQVGQTDVRNCTIFSVYLKGITGGGSVTIEGSPDNGATWVAIGAARTTDVLVTVTDLWDYVRFNVTTGKASATGWVKRMVAAYV